MKEYFFSISEKIMNSIASDEHLNLSINGENSELFVLIMRRLDKLERLVIQSLALS